MNPLAYSEEKPGTPGRWDRRAWLPIPLLLAAIIAARMAGLRDSYESHTLLIVLSFAFYTLVSLGTLYLVGRSFLASGTPGLLLLECGVVLWSLAGTIGDLVAHGDANIAVTIFNTGIWLAGLCHLAGAILALNRRRVLGAKRFWLAAGCAFALGALWLVSHAALRGWLPVFFIPGGGGTPVRYSVLISAITMFVLSAGVLHANQRAVRLPFTSWYTLALLLLAVGLFGVMIQLSLGSVVNWLSRASQWLGGLYLLFAAIASLRESQLPLLPLENKPYQAYYRESFAAAVVFAAAAIRLAFLSALGMQAPFLTFYPAVMFAAMYGGLRAGLLATALSAIFVDYFWIEPAGFAIGQPSDWLAMTVFLLSGAMIAGVSDAMHRARASAAEMRALLAAERAAAAETLRESEERFRKYFELGLIGMAITSPAKGMLEVNEKICEILGYERNELLKLTWAELTHGGDLAAEITQFNKVLAGEIDGYSIDKRFVRKNGEIIDTTISVNCIRLADGSVDSFLALVQDITARKRAEEALRASEALLRAVTDNSPDAIYVKDRESRWLMANPAVLRIVGKSAQEARGKTDMELYPDPEIGRAILENDRRILERWEPEAFEEFADTPEGRRTFLSIKAPWRDAHGNITGIVGISRDITERKRANEALMERTRQLEHANKELESFSYSISHDLRAPLRAISGFTGMLLKSHQGLFDADAKRKFQVIDDNVRKMGQLIDDLLALSRSSRQAMSLSLLDMEALVKDVWQEQCTINPNRNIELRNGFLPEAFGDRTLIRQVLAIVQQTIARHGGRVWGKGKEDEGATFYFSLPLPNNHTGGGEISAP